MVESVIFSASLSQYKALSWQGQDVYTRYPALKNHLLSSLGADFAALLTEPIIQVSPQANMSTAKWSSNVVSKKSVPFSQLPSSSQSIITEAYEQKMERIASHVADLLAKGDQQSRNTAELIEQAFTIPDTDHIRVEGDKFVLVAWGFEYSNTKLSGSTFTRKLPIAKVPHREPEKEVTLTESEGATNDKTASSDKTPEVNEKEELPIAPSSPPVEPENQDKEEPKPQDPIDEATKKETGGFFKKWWWLLLLLLALLLLIWFLATSNNNLPSQPGVLPPIDSTQIAMSPDSMRNILTTRINVALVGKNTDQAAFANEFKKIWKGSNYKVIYYDTTLTRLQLDVPSNEREQVKKDLPKKLPQFEMLIWEESMYKSSYVPQDPGFKVPADYWHLQKVKALDAWDVTKGGSNVTIAVIDEGFDVSHPEFRGKVVKPWNVVSRVSSVNLNRDNDHGTHVAGIALGLADNGSGVSGVAPNCKLMPIQVADRYGQMSTTAIMDGIIYAVKNGADIINISLGEQTSPFVKYLPQSQQLNFIKTARKDEEAMWTNIFKYAYSHNVIVVLAAGNDGVMTGLDPMDRSPYAVTVGAVDQYGRKADFSNYGKYTVISAPGVGIFSSVPNGRYQMMDGTSMASPMVAGGIALIKTIKPSYTYKQIVDLLQRTGLPTPGATYSMPNLMQLNLAANTAKPPPNNNNQVSCPNVQKQIDSLLLEVAKLRELCPGSSNDTFAIPPNPNNVNFALGRWKSNSDLKSSTTNEKVELYFDFYADGTGRVTYAEASGNNCEAPLALIIKTGRFVADQTTSANCADGGFDPHRFECQTDANGQANCTALDKRTLNNLVNFKLIRINNF